MTEQDENDLLTLSLFDENGILSYHDIYEKYGKQPDDELYGLIMTSAGRFERDGYSKRGSRKDGDISVITEKGKKYYEKLKAKKSEEEIAKVHFEDEKVLLRQVHNSVIETNNSTRDTNKSIRRLNRNQIFVIWISVLLSLLTLIVLYKQLKLLEK